MATLYYVIGPSSGWGTPTAANVKAGQLSGGGAATASGSTTAPTVTTSPFTFPSAATGLTANTVYRVAVVLSDGSQFPWLRKAGPSPIPIRTGNRYGRRSNTQQARR